MKLTRAQKKLLAAIAGSNGGGMDTVADLYHESARAFLVKHGLAQPKSNNRHLLIHTSLGLAVLENEAERHD